MSRLFTGRYLRTNRPLRSQVRRFRREHPEFEFGAVHDVEFSHDGTKVAVVYGDLSVSIWDITSEEERPIADVEAFNLAFGNQSNQLAIAGPSGVQLFDVVTGTIEIVSGELVKVPCLECAFSPDDAFLAWPSRGELILWDRNKPETLVRRRDPNDWLFALAFAKHRPWVAVSSGGPARIEVWNFKTGEMVFEKPLRESHETTIYTLAFGMNDQALFSGDDSGLVVRWNTDDWKVSSSYRHGAAVRTLMPSPTGEWILTGGMDGIVNKVLPSVAPYPKLIQRNSGYITNRSQFTSDGAELVVLQAAKGTTQPRLYSRYRLDKDKTSAEFRFEPPIALSRKHQWVATRSAHDKGVVIWDGKTGQQHRVLPLEHDPTAIAISARGETLAIADDTRLHVFEITSGKPVASANKRVKQL